MAETSKGGVGTYLDQIVPPQIALFGSKSVLVILPQQHSIQVPNVPCANVVTFDRPSRSLGSLLRLAWCLVNNVRAFAPDIVHAQSTFAGIVVRALFAFKKQRPRIVFCPHGWVFDTQANRLTKAITEIAERLMARLCDRVVAISEHEAREARRIGIDPPRIRVIHNGIRIAGPEPKHIEWEDSRLKILFIGRLDRQKGFDLLVDAVTGLEDRLHVRVVGEAILSDGGVFPKSTENIELLGWRSEAEIVSLLQQADLVVIPSRWEGFGLVAIEAMRAGKPVIASNVGGLPEIIQDNVTGKLVPPTEVAALRSAILSMDESERERMGSMGRKRFLEQFTLNHCHSQLVALYDELAR